jgi:flagellar basal body-associated protein FliL
MDNKKNNKIIIYVLIVLTIVSLIAGATFAYWTWSTVRSNETNVSVVVSGSIGDLYARFEGGEPISTDNVELLPTSNCMSDRTLNRTVSMTYKNGTNKVALVEAQLDLTDISFDCSKIPTSEELSHVHWAITRNDTSCTSNLVSSGTFEYVDLACSSNTPQISYYNHPLYGAIKPLYGFTTTGSNHELITEVGLPMISIKADPNMENETTETFYVYVWVDEDYVWTNYGDVNSDPLSDLSFKLEWHAKIDQNLICGDITGNGLTEIIDINLLSEVIVANIPATGRYWLLGDANGDGNVNTGDLPALYQIILGNTTGGCPIS